MTNSDPNAVQESKDLVVLRVYDRNPIRARRTSLGSNLVRTFQDGIKNSEGETELTYIPHQVFSNTKPNDGAEEINRNETNVPDNCKTLGGDEQNITQLATRYPSRDGIKPDLYILGTSLFVCDSLEL